MLTLGKDRRRDQNTKCKKKIRKKRKAKYNRAWEKDRDKEDAQRAKREVRLFPTMGQNRSFLTSKADLVLLRKTELFSFSYRFLFNAFNKRVEDFSFSQQWK